MINIRTEYLCDVCKKQVDSLSDLFEFINYSIVQQPYFCYDVVNIYETQYFKLSKNNQMICNSCLNKLKK